VNNVSQGRPSTARHRKEFAALRDLSARLGGDPLLVQASNGNASIKLDGILWVKASGKWLAHAAEEEMFVPLELARVKRSVRNDLEIASPYALNDELRPSIETAMHAVLRHRVVLHVHSINAIAWAIRLDGPNRLAERLAGLHWQWIPYAASGIPLARRVAREVAGRPEVEILILGNHGLVVCGPDCSTTEKLLREVEQRLEITPRRFPKPDTTLLTMISRFSRWQFPDTDLMHALGTDAASQKILKGGVLYPCQAIFLGPTMPLVPPTAVISDFTERSNGQAGSPAFVAIEGSGVLLNEKMTSAERATLIGLVQVALRTEGSRPLRYLKAAEIMAVLGQGARGYRQVLVTETNARSELKPVDWQSKMIYKRNGTGRELSSSARQRQHQRGV
jgi:ribulose-5-phosphate 4-epimerase/fuculose-1-phosphate aldolase